MEDKGLPILCFSSTDWEGVWGSRQQVMLRFARLGYRVLYVEQLAGLEHLLRYPELRQRKRQLQRQGLRAVAENLWVANPPPLLPGRYYSLLVNQLNARLVVRWARGCLSQLGFQAPILWVYKPEHGALLGRFGERLSVYHCIDAWGAGMRGRKRQVIDRLEGELLKRVDLVFANSPPTYAEKRRLHPRTFRLPSGVDVEHYALALKLETPEHTAIASLPRPRIGYSGTINERLDYACLEYLARQRPDWSLVFVGDIYPWTPDAPPLRRLRALPNVHFLGKFPFEQLPALLKGMDVCLVPYVDDERGHYRSPLKLYEYLAAGKPVVSTPHPEVQEFAESVYLAATPQVFVEAVAQALAEDDALRRRQRLEIARQNSWERRVDTMETLIQQRLRGEL